MGVQRAESYTSPNVCVICAWRHLVSNQNFAPIFVRGDIRLIELNQSVEASNILVFVRKSRFEMFVTLYDILGCNTLNVFLKQTPAFYMRKKTPQRARLTTEIRLNAKK